MNGETAPSSRSHNCRPAGHTAVAFFLGEIDGPVIDRRFATGSRHVSGIQRLAAAPDLRLAILQSRGRRPGRRRLRGFLFAPWERGDWALWVPTRLQAVRFSLPGPQRLGTGGTVNLILLPLRSPKARDRGHSQLDFAPSPVPKGQGPGAQSALSGKGTGTGATRHVNQVG